MALGSLNEATLMGNLGRDPEVRRLNDGTPVLNMSLATSESWKDKQTGERKEKVEWHTIVVWGQQGKDGGLVGMIEKWLAKGDKAYVRGQIQTRKWKDKDGNDRWSTEIHVRGFAHSVQIITSKKMDKEHGGRNDAAREEQLNDGPPPAGGGNRLDDDIPF